MPQADTIGKASQLKVCRQDLVPAHFGPVKAGPSLARSLTNVVDRPAPSKALRQLACVLPQLAQTCELAPWRQLARSANWQCTHPCRRQLAYTRQLVLVTCRPLPSYALGQGVGGPAPRPAFRGWFPAGGARVAVARSPRLRRLHPPARQLALASPLAPQGHARRATPARQPWQAPPGIGRGAPPAARPGLEGRSPQTADVWREGRSGGSRCDAAGPSAWPALSHSGPPRTPSPTAPHPTIAKSR
jgi:hypothetical protein